MLTSFGIESAAMSLASLSDRGSLGSFDWLVLFLAIACSIGLGIYFSRRNKSLDGYLLGDRSLPWWAILGSIVATETSTATVLSVPSHGLSDTGLRFLQLPLGLLCGRFLVVWILLPLFFQGKLSSAYQVLQKRFGRSVSQTAGTLFLLTRTLGDGLRLYLAGIVIQQLLGTTLTFACCLVGLLTILYTVFGGMRSIVWNDCIQWCIYMLGGVVSLCVIVGLLPDGWASLWEHGQQTGKWQLIDFDWRLSYNFWGGLFGGVVLSMGTHGTDQMMVQRYLSARNQREAGRALWLSGVVVLLQFALFVVIGIALSAFYHETGAAHPEKNDQVFSYFVIHQFPQNTGLVGLLLAAIFAATMSTLSSSLNASASCVMHDFLLSQNPEASRWSAAQQLLWARGLTLGFGLAQIAIGIQAQYLAANVVDNSLKIAGFTGGLLLGLFLLGICTRRVGQFGALVGFSVAVGSIATLWLFGPVWGIELGPPWFALIGATITMGVGVLASWFSPAQGHSDDPARSV